MPGANITGGDILGSIIEEVIIPELVAFFHKFHKDTGTLPTSEQVLAEYETHRARYEAVGQAFLDRTNPPVGDTKPAIGTA